MTGETPVWTRLDALDDRELDLLVQAALGVLEDHADDARLAAIHRLPPSRLAAELGTGQGLDAAAADRLVSDEALSRPVTVAILRSLSHEPLVAAEVESAYEARRGMMVVDGGVLLAAALLTLVLKLKRVHVGRSGADVELSELKADVLQEIRRIVSG